MQMLYRLSYVGASSGLLDGSAGLWMFLWVRALPRMQSRSCVLAREDAAFPRDVHVSEVEGEECEPGNLVPAGARCQRKTSENFVLRRF